jgi:hypothetical protein
MAADFHPLRGRTIAIATMHGKEAVLAPPLRQRLDIECVLARGLDTDAYGTFVGEVARRGTALDAARAKARAAMQLCGTRSPVKAVSVRIRACRWCRWPPNWWS